MKTRDEALVDSVSESSYYLSEQAAHLVRSGAANVARFDRAKEELVRETARVAGT